MIYFRKIRWKNFLSTGNIFTEVQLDRSSNTLIIGTNGAGKSTMLDALTFSLFGKAFRDVNKPDLVNTVNDRDCVVEVEFRIGLKEYKIVRGLKPVVFEIYCDDKLIDQDGARLDYQAYLESNILKFNHKAFTQIVILGASSFVPFMKLTANDRRMIIEDLLDIQVFTSMNTVVKTKLNDIKSSVLEIKSAVESTLAKIDMQKKYVEEAKKNNQTQIDAKTKEHDDNLAYIKKTEADAALIQKYIDVLLKSISDETAVQDKIKKLQTFSTKIESNKNKVVKERNFFLDNDSCPTCTQIIQSEVKKSSINKANTKIAEFESATLEISKQYETLSGLIASFNETRKKINEHVSELTRLNAGVTQVRKYTDKLMIDIAELKNKKVLSDDMIKVSEDLVNSLEVLQKRKIDVSEEKKYLDVASILLKDNGIKAKIIKQYLPVINKLVNKYLSSMDFFVNFEIDEEFNETIKSRHRDTFGYGNFSEGEKLRIDLALLFTWRAVAKLKNSLNTNLLILDEIFDSSLDANGTEEFLKLLESLGQDSNVFVISHKGDILIDKFKSVIKFDKVQLFSRIV